MKRSRVKIFPGSTICAETMFIGDITFGNNCIVHPYVQILALSGPVVIGDNCIIEERVQIINRAPLGSTIQPTKKKGPPLVIGSDNMLEVGCRIESKKIGNRNIFESKSLVGDKVTVGNDCVIGAGCKLTEEVVLENSTAVYGQNCTLRKVSTSQTRHPDFMETVSRILLRNHPILKVTHQHQSSKCQNRF